jgi:hypothetical protein
MWSYLQPVEHHQNMDIGCNRLVTVARDIYTADSGGGLSVALMINVQSYFVELYFQVADSCVDFS